MSNKTTTADIIPASGSAVNSIENNDGIQGTGLAHSDEDGEKDCCEEKTTSPKPGDNFFEKDGSQNSQNVKSPDKKSEDSESYDHKNDTFAEKTADKTSGIGDTRESDKRRERSIRLRNYLITGSHFVEERIAAWQREAAEIQREYPEFSMEKAFSDPVFLKMLSCGVTMKQSLCALNYDSLLKSDMKKARDELSREIMKNALRPGENGMNGRGGVVVKSGVTTFSRSQRAELAARAFNGERIKL